jgi:hypothetical protein
MPAIMDNRVVDTKRIIRKNICRQFLKGPTGKINT